MSALFTNNATTTLAVAINASITTLTVNSGSVFPVPTGGDFFTVTLVDFTNDVYEIVECTSISGNDLTVVRGREGTSPESFPIGALVECRPTAATLNRIDAKALNDLTDVSAATPSPDQVIVWNGSGWIAADQSGGGGGSSTLAGLSDVDTSGVQNGNALVYNLANLQWEPGVNGDVTVSSESTVDPIQLAVVDVMPGTPDPNTIYFVV